MQNLLRHLIRVDQHIQKGGAGGRSLLVGGGAVGGGQVEEGVHLVGRRWDTLSRDASQMMQNKSGATWLLPPLWDSCSSTRSGRGGRRRGRTLPGWTLTRWTLSWKIKDVETYHVSSSVQSREATSSTVSRPGIWLAGEIRTWFWQWSSWIYGRCWRWCLIGISLTNLWHINCLSMMQGRAPQMSPRSEVLHTGIFNSVSSQTSFRQNCWKSNVSLSMISLFSWCICY